ncbi:putative ribosomal protein YMR- mitochondrial [Rosellinia necatrix]|uniref:Putative ribosomal protein YMR-mitochondrial n=1 Tax=Rosellinia necatrix TaxID=77044 RepID=A0A1W2TK47_ROSNE|nr:putative ribosomal protein YMR- mitochondrial [Rosellinia necatrix]
MFATRALRQAAAHGAERTPMIHFLGKRQIPSNVDHTPQPHPASPTGSLPSNFGNGNSHTTFSSYRDSAQQHGPLRKSFGAQSASKLGPIDPPKGHYFDRNELPERFRRSPLSMAEIEAVETGGAAIFG